MAYEQKKYEQSEAVKQAAAQLAAANAQKPGAYQSEYQPQLKDLAGQILNRKDFQFDLNGDALYNQYKDRYVGLGQQAMMDTMGQAAKMTGGYGNSYAQMAGQQAYHGYLQGLNDKVPELYQLALDRYNQQGQDLMNRYGMLNAQEQQAYDRYLNSYNMWNNERAWLADMLNAERNFDYGAHRDAVSDSQWQTAFDENNRQWQTAFDENNRQWQKEFDYGANRDAVSDSQWQTAFDESNRQWQSNFDEDLRRWNFDNKQGEYAVAPPVYTGSSSSSRNPRPNPTGNMDGVYQALYNIEQAGVRLDKMLGKKTNSK